jgi:hypothetical protein
MRLSSIAFSAIPHQSETKDPDPHPHHISATLHKTEPWTLTIEAWRVADSYHFDEEQDPDPEPH